MAVNLLAAAGFSQQSFRLVSRQELSRQAGGSVIAKDLGPAIWVAEWSTMMLELDDMVEFEALIHSLDGSIGTFLGYDLRRPYPKSAPTGDFSESTLAVHTVGDDGKSLRLDGLPASFVITLGDYVCVIVGEDERVLVQAMETVTADGSGVTPSFEVRPHLRPSVAIDDPVTLKTPSTLMRLQPGPIGGQIEGGLFGAVTFSAVEAW